MNTIKITATIKITMSSSTTQTNILTTTANISGTANIAPAPNNTKVSDVKENKDVIEIDESKEDEEDESKEEEVEEEIKIATPEEINSIKHNIATNNVVNSFEQHFTNEIKTITFDTVSVIEKTSKYGSTYINKRCIQIPLSNTLDDKYILKYMTHRYGYEDFKLETAKYTHYNSLYKYYSFASTLEANYTHHVSEATKKRKLLDGLNKDLNDMLREKRRRLA